MKLSTKENLEKVAFQIRLGIIRAISSNRGGHIGGSLDLADMMAVVYTDFMRVDPANPRWEDRDFMIFSRVMRVLSCILLWHTRESSPMSVWII